MMMSAVKTWEEAVLWLREQEEYQKLVLDCYYDDPVRTAAERFYNSSEWKAVQALLWKLKIFNGNVADIGAGRGISSFSFARDGFTVNAFEPDPSSIVGAGAIASLYKETGLPIKIFSNYGEKLHVPDNSFDLVYIRAALHHAKDINSFCREIGRVLRPGGYLLVTREHVISKISDKKLFLNNHPLHRLYGGENAYLLKDYIIAFKNSSLKMKHVLYPCSSPINLFPQTMEDLIKLKQTKIPLPLFIIEFLIKMKNRITFTPGALFTFICQK